MAEDAPDPRAKAIADKLLGRGGKSDVDEAASILAGGASVGRRDDNGRPIASTVRKIGENDGSQAEKRPKSNGRDRQSAQQTAETDDESEVDDLVSQVLRSEGVSDADENDEETDGDAARIAEEDDTEEDGTEYETLDYDDEDEFDVIVDGEKRTATLRELKKAFSGEGAIEKRLKEATEARKAATATREAALQEVTGHRAALMQTIQQLDQVLFMPMVDEPDPKLRSSNINEYLMQKDAWEEDQKRIVKSRTDLAAFFQQQQTETNQARQAFRQEQMQLLADKMPELADPVKAPKVQKQIMDAAAHYGFSAEQVAQVDNHGLFLMARDAARWLNLQELKRNGGASTSGGEKLRRRKRLRSGTVTDQKAKLSRSAKERAAAVAKAQSGKVDDVANMLATTARVKGPNRGRSR